MGQKGPFEGKKRGRQVVSKKKKRLKGRSVQRVCERKKERKKGI